MGIEIGQSNWVNEAGQATKSHTIVVIFDKEVQDKVASDREGRPIFKLQQWITKENPGDGLVKIERKLRDTDKSEFPEAWERYQKKVTVPLDGTPITEWPLLNRAQVAEFNALGIYTVEQFLTMPEGHGHKIMGFNEIRRKAQIFLSQAKELEKAQAQEKTMQAALAERDAQIEQLQKQMAALMEPKKRGRPPKVNNAANPP